MAGLGALLSSELPFLTDGGLETDLIFNDGCELPLFSAFVLLDSAGKSPACRRTRSRSTTPLQRTRARSR